MRKTRFAIISAVLLLMLAMPVSVLADSSYGDPDWGVTFTAQEKMESNFDLAEFNDKIYGMQPGDDVTITLTLKNSHPDLTAWYMTNSVLQSLEDASSVANGGAYSYLLKYESPNLSRELFNSDTVGGTMDENSEGREGLYGATDDLEKYFFLDKLESGQSGVVTLRVALEGETQGNDYQDTLAKLMMNFAVELQPKNEIPPDKPPKNTDIVITGEQVHPKTLLIVAGVSGALLLALGIVGLKFRRTERKEARS